MMSIAERWIEKNNMGTLTVKTIERLSKRFPIIYNDRSEQE